jgi:hypothetical protein
MTFDESTFEYAKKYTVMRLSRLVSLAESLDSQFPGKGFMDSAIKLNLLQLKLEKASERCITDTEFNEVQKFGLQLISFEERFVQKLKDMWLLYYDIFLFMKKDMKPYDLQGIIHELVERINETDVIANQVILAARKQRLTILSPMSLLLIHLIRTETIEHIIIRQFNNAIEQFNLADKYDIFEMCSVTHKVQRGKRWVTDVRALRDAVAHGHFHIETAKKDWLISFENKECGYSFKQTFSKDEFERFFDANSLLHGIQIHLLMVFELLIYGANYLHIDHSGHLADSQISKPSSEDDHSSKGHGPL